MPAARVSDDEFVALFHKLQSSTRVAEHLGVTIRSVQMRRRDIEARKRIALPVFDERKALATVRENKAVATLTLDKGTVLIGSDAHVWPGPLTTMQRAFLLLAKKLKPAAVIMNGDVFDGARVSRWPHSSWSDEKQKPSVRQELEAVGDFLGAVVKAAPSAKRFWTFGNHDQRFEARLLSFAPEYSGVKGTSLRDHFPEWHPAWRVDINDSVIVRHRELAGEHADYRNVVTSGGRTMVTGHDHRAGVTPYASYGGLHFGVRCGYMAEDQEDPQFVNYLEARKPNWHPAFAVLTFRGGRLLWPELCVKHDETSVEFRGEILEV